MQEAEPVRTGRPRKPLILHDREPDKWALGVLRCSRCSP